MPTVTAILLDWRGTLAALPRESEWIARALDRIRRPASEEHAQRVVAALVEAVKRPEIQQTWPRVDTSSTVHRDTYYRLFDLAGIDADLADALYAAESDVASNPFAVDVPETIAALAEAGLKIAVISDDPSIARLHIVLAACGVTGGRGRTNPPPA